MIERLQRKFVIIAMSSLMLIILILIGLINAVNMYHIDRWTDGAIHVIAENEGLFPKFDRERPPLPPFGSGFEFQLTPETGFETRYFTAIVAGDGTVTAVDTSHIAAIGKEEARAYSEDIIARGRTKGFRDHYKYKAIDKPYGAMVVVLDCRAQIQTAVVLLEVSGVIAVLSLAVMFVLVSVLSKRATKPVQISLEKQKQFITDAGHEIKTPLAIISSNADVLEITNGENEWISSIRNQTIRLDNLVKKLLILSKVEEGTARQIYVGFNISDMVRQVVTEFQPVADAQGKIITYSMPSSSVLYGVEEEIRQMVAILLDNAIKYASSESSIQVKLFSRGKKALLEVRNSLDAPPVDDLDRLFDRFFRADNSRSRESGGYGIGLSIAKSVVKAHKGDIQAVYENEKRVICIRVQLPKQHNMIVKPLQ